MPELFELFIIFNDPKIKGVGLENIFYPWLIKSFLIFFILFTLSDEEL